MQFYFRCLPLIFVLSNQTNAAQIFTLGSPINADGALSIRTQDGSRGSGWSSDVVISSMEMTLDDSGGTPQLALTGLDASYNSYQVNYQETVNLGFSGSETLDVSVTLYAGRLQFDAPFSSAIQYTLETSGTGTFNFGNVGSYYLDAIANSTSGFSHTLTGSYSILGDSISRTGTFSIPTTHFMLYPYYMSLDTNAFPSEIDVYARASYGQFFFAAGFGRSPNDSINIFSETFGFDDVSIDIRRFSGQLASDQLPISLSSVPEPNSIILSFLGLISVFGCRKSR